MEFKQYIVPNVGYISVVKNSELFDQLYNNEFEGTLLDVHRPYNEPSLTNVGDLLRSFVESLQIRCNYTVFTQSGVNLDDQHQVYKRCFNSIFKSASLTYTPINDPISDTNVRTIELSYKQGGIAPVCYVQRVKLQSADYYNVDFVNPPQRTFCGIVTGDVLTAGIKVQSYVKIQFILAKEDLSEQLQVSVSFTFEVGNNTIQILRQMYDYVHIDVEALSTVLDNQIEESSDPYGDGDNIDPDGGFGNKDDESDNIEEPSKPLIDACDGSFVTLYKPTTAELRQLFEYLWGESWWDYGAEFRNEVFNPFKALISLHIVPVLPVYSTAQELTLGKWGTGINMLRITEQFVKIDCGSIFIVPYYDTFLDYSPYTKYDIYLPFIGVKSLDPDVITGKTVSVSYMFDVLTGICVQFVKVNSSVFYTFTGSCKIDLPLTATNYTSLTTPLLGQISAGMQQALFPPSTQQMAQPNVASSVLSGIKQEPKMTGSITGSSGYMSNRTPFLTIIRPNLVINPENARQKVMGYPSQQFYKLGDLKGYTEVEDIQLYGIVAQYAEMIEIEQLLKQGVVI